MSIWRVLRKGTWPSTALTDAWRTIVPARDDPHGPLPPILLALTVVFVANMTGNVVFLGEEGAVTAGRATRSPPRIG
jgi:hypothetical protein